MSNIPRLIQRNKPKRRRINRLPHGQEAMVLQDDRLPIAEVLRDPLPLLPIEHHPSKLRVHRMVFIKPQTILRDHIELPSKNRERLAIHTMRMARSVNIRPRLMNLRVDRERSGVDGLVADDDFAVFVDQDQV